MIFSLSEKKPIEPPPPPRRETRLTVSQRSLGLSQSQGFKMASNGIVFRPGRGPSFILVGLVVIVIILFYSYWGVSSKNNKLLRDVSVLQDRLRVLAARKLTADKKGSALVSQITQMQDEKEKEINSKDSKISDMTKTLQTREAELTKFREQEVGKGFLALRINLNTISLIRLKLSILVIFFYFYSLWLAFKLIQIIRC